MSVFDETKWSVQVPRPRYEALMAWLQAHGPDEWHGVAVTWNYGHGGAPLAWIAMQGDCDAATAQDIFWKCNGGEHFENGRILTTRNPADFDEGFELAQLIATRWEDGLYVLRELKLDKDTRDMIDDMYQIYLSHIAGLDQRSLPWRAPQPTFPDDGYVVDENFFSEGFPRQLARDPEEARKLYLSSLSSTRHWYPVHGRELPPYWFGEKLGWITANEIPLFVPDRWASSADDQWSKIPAGSSVGCGALW
ncbi:MAG TPA: DUF4274 domain-containing protein [Rhizobiaceae bacterium]|nr:DUF4274 domain-containing protein [Rhizobiaceae bacterium]